MIPLTRLNHQELILNSDLIKCIEQPHDTVVTLVTGEKLTVEESPAEIVQRISDYRHGYSGGPRPLLVLPPPKKDEHGSQ